MIIRGKEFKEIREGVYGHTLPSGDVLSVFYCAPGYFVADIGNCQGYAQTPEAAILNLFELLGEELDDHRRESMNRDMYERAMQRHVDYLEDLCKSK